MKFEWNEQKRERNIERHGVDFVTVCELFQCKDTLHFEDDRKDYGEKRFILMGELKGIFFQVAYTLRDSRIRIISARRGNKREKALYEKKKNNPSGIDG